MTVGKHKWNQIGNRWIGTLCLSALLGASACSTQEEGADVPPLLSDTRITLSSPEWTPIVQSRAALFEKEGQDWLDETKGGRNFTLSAYMESTGQTLINRVRTYYFINEDDPADTEWMMLDESGAQVTYYWPYSGALNFFAYMPDMSYNGKVKGYVAKETHVEVLPYDPDNGQQFTCDLPAEADPGKEKTQEFLYAYEAGKTRQEEPLELCFHHPFAFINFKLKTGSYRMTVDNINFHPIHLKGTFSTKREEWVPDSDKQEYKAVINKRIPRDINYNTNLSEWFVVMPQALEGVTLTFHATRPTDPTGVSESDITGTYTFGEGEKWLPGHKYTYIISYGNNKEEIYFDVKVEEWAIGNEQDINVE